MRTNEVWLYKNTNLTKQDTMKFDTITEQSAFFYGKRYAKIETNERVITDSVRVTDENYYDLMSIDYISSEKVIDGKTKTMYYFVNEVESVNDNLTVLHVELDVVQTYMIDYEIVNANVIRQHENRYDEDGNRVWNREREPITVNNFEYLEGQLYDEKDERGGAGLYYILATKKQEGSIENAELNKYGNLHSYLETSISAFYYNSSNKTMERVYYDRLLMGGAEEKMMANLEVMSKVSYEAELVDIVIVPYLPGFEYYRKGGKHFIKNDSIGPGGLTDQVSWRSYGESTAGGGSSIAIKNLSIPYTELVFDIVDNPINIWMRGATGDLKISAYKESKLYSPQFMEATIVEGVDNKVNFYLDELTKDTIVNNKAKFPYVFGNSITKTFSIGVRGYKIPNNIMMANVSDALILMSDEYLNSLKFEANSRSAAKLNGVINAVAGLGITAVSGGSLAPLALGQTTGLFTSRLTEQAKLDDLRNKPIKLGSELDNVDFNLSYGNMKPRVMLKLPSEDDRARLVKFFKDYGYAANKNIIPNLTSREVFNYIQMDNLILKGNIPAIDKEELKQIYGAGIRLWHNPSTFLNFEIDNDEVL